MVSQRHLFGLALTIAELFRLPVEAIFSLKPMTPLSEEVFREPPQEPASHPPAAAQAPNPTPHDWTPIHPGMSKNDSDPPPTGR